MAQIKIVIKRTQGTVIFEPNTAEVTAQDNAFWQNNDSEAHKPTPLDKNGNMVQGVWLNYQIPPASSSSGVAFFNPDKTFIGSEANPQNAPYTINYVCALHTTEKGSIRVKS